MEYRIYCSGCGVQSEAYATSPLEARRLAELNDWHINGAGGYECPDCQRSIDGEEEDIDGAE